nr:hypothetical protein [uncultured Flavobacterium sp.]
MSSKIITVTEENQLIVWGMVTCVIKKFTVLPQCSQRKHKKHNVCELSVIHCEHCD